MKLPPAVVFLGAPLLLVVGAVCGRLTAPDPAPTVAPAPTGTRPAGAQAPRHAPEPLRPTHAAPDGHAHAAPAGGAAPAAEEHHGEAAADAPAVELGPVLAAGRAAHAAPDDHHLAEAAQAASRNLEQQLIADPVALSQALERWRALRDPGELELLAAVLGHIADPEVEEAALEMARGDADPTRRASAFDVLDALESPAGIASALEVLGRETDVELRRAALRAIPEARGVAAAEAGPVVSALRPILRGDPDAELRRRAATLLGSWHRGDAELAPVVQALSRDASIDVRAGCAFALEIAGNRSPAVLEALRAAVASAQEDPLVRENAWRALSGLGPLPPQVHAAFAAYRDVVEAAGEGGE